jgi:hypothetical protein
MTTNNNKVQSHEHYITKPQKLVLCILQGTYFGLYGSSLLALLGDKIEIATLVTVWGYIVEKFHSKYEDRVETLAFNAEWEAEREAEVAAKQFAEEFKQAVDKSKQTLTYLDKKKPTYSESIEKLFESNKDWLKDIDTPSVQDSIEDKKPTVKKKKKNG